MLKPVLSGNWGFRGGHWCFRCRAPVSDSSHFLLQQPTDGEHKRWARRRLVMSCCHGKGRTLPLWRFERCFSAPILNMDHIDGQREVTLTKATAAETFYFLHRAFVWFCPRIAEFFLWFTSNDTKQPSWEAATGLLHLFPLRWNSHDSFWSCRSTFNQHHPTVDVFIQTMFRFVSKRRFQSMTTGVVSTFHSREGRSSVSLFRPERCHMVQLFLF